ncbi:HAD family hydrolase [Haloplanus sp. GCM10025708]|uniref:HAD family hydrolase n=1 Tax=Haloferacaceae TaxID=1644056 RepID=UPI00360F8217
MAVSFDLFGTLVCVPSPSDPAAAVGDALDERGVPVPADWDDAYRERHVDAPPGAETPLPAHVAAALRSRGVYAPGAVVRRAVAAAFDPDVRTREGAAVALDAARTAGPVALCSNCSVPGLVSRALARAELDRDAFDAVVTSVGCGWRKPDERAFHAVAAELGVRADDLVHVGDDERTDGGVESVGGCYVDVSDAPLAELPQRLEATP